MIRGVDNFRKNDIQRGFVEEGGTSCQPNKCASMKDQGI